MGSKISLISVVQISWSTSGEQYQGSKVYIDIEDNGCFYVSLEVLQLLK